MKSIVESIERGLASANYHADLASKRRALSAWGTVERKGLGWSWRWSGLGLCRLPASTKTQFTTRWNRSHDQDHH